MSIITESRATRRLTVLLVMIMGVAMIIPSNLAFASPDDGSDDDGSENQDDGFSDEGTTEEDDQTEPEETEEQLTEEPIEELPPIDDVLVDPCVEDPDACALEPEPPIDPCLDNPDLPECQPPADPCLDNPDLPECQPPADPCLDNPDLPECQAPVLCPDGGAHGIQQKFDSIKYQACGLYPTGQIAYTDGFVLGCTQVGNTQQLCQAFVVMNTQQTQTAAIQPNMQPTTQPTQAIQPSGVS